MDRVFLEVVLDGFPMWEGSSVPRGLVARLPLFVGEACVGTDAATSEQEVPMGQDDGDGSDKRILAWDGTLTFWYRRTSVENGRLTWNTRSQGVM